VTNILAHFVLNHTVNFSFGSEVTMLSKMCVNKTVVASTAGVMSIINFVGYIVIFEWILIISTKTN